jgi:very-short-patch-repair endonuclease
MSDERLAELAATQHGLVRRDQALALLTNKQIESRVRSGRLLIPRPGVLAVAGAPPTWRQGLLAACWASGGVASHRAAGALWGLRGLHEGDLEILVPSPRWVRLPGVRAHRSNCLDRRFLAERDGIPVTTPARTMVDLSAVVHPMFLERLLADGVRGGVTTVAEVRVAVDALARRGRRRVAVMRAVLDAWTEGDGRAESAGEAGLVRLLVEAGLPRPVQQVQVVVGRRLFVLDLAYPRERVAIEFDGWAVHGDRLAFDRDRERDNVLQAAGWQVFRFTSRSTPGEIVATVRAALGHLQRPGRAPTPSVRSQRGEVVRAS